MAASVYLMCDDNSPPCSVCNNWFNCKKQQKKIDDGTQELYAYFDNGFIYVGDIYVEGNKITLIKGE